MSTPNESLPLVTAALAVAAASLSLAGLRHSRYPGWNLWLAAMWLSTLGALAGSVLPAPLGPALLQALTLQWPMLALAGLRRFHPRQALRARAGTDWLLLALASTATLALTLAESPGAAWISQVAALGVHLYVATLLLTSPGGREGTPVQVLGLTVVLAGLTELLCTLPGAELLSPMAASVSTATLGTVVLAFVALTLASDRTERQLRESQRRLRLLANLDPLTQVPNRRRFQELAADALRRDKPGSAVLVLFDVDHFKQINDVLGHAAGDRALCLVCASVLEHLRTHDVPGRHGGDEFVLLLRQTNPHDALSVAARIVADVQCRAPAQKLPRLSLSFGVVQVGLVEDIASALRRADQALYEAKRQGRSRAVAAAGDESRPVFSESQRLGLTPA